MPYRTMPLGRQILLPAMLLILVFTIMIALTAWLTGQATVAQAQLELGTGSSTTTKAANPHQEGQRHLSVLA